MPVVDYYHFLISPWSYLAIPRLAAIQSRTGVRFRYLPIDVGRTFGDMGGTPPAKRHPSRQSWRLEELQRFSEHLDIPMNLQPAYFPADQSLAARLVLAAGHGDTADMESAAGKLSDAILTACWQREQNIADETTLLNLMRELDLDAEGLMSSAQSESVGQQFAATTDEAHARGVFGSPTLIVGEQRFWGQDRLDFAEAAIQKLLA